MANRILRDWTTSERIDKLSLNAEVFFTRLIMRADDHGCFHANVKLLKAALFPLKDISLRDIDKWLNECSSAGIVHVYESENRQYLKILDFGQRLRDMRSKFPQPAATCGNPPPESETNPKRNETESEQPPLRAFLPDIFLGEDVQAAWEEWEKYKKEKKQKLTPSTAKKQMQFLGGRAGPEAIAIINQSITNGWTGLFELKSNTNGNGNTTKTSIRRADATIVGGKEFGEL